jgi:hypothetical protein
MEYTREELFAKFDNLPDEVQEAFLSIDTYDAIKAVADKHHLHLDQAGQLSEQIGFVILGILRPENFLSAVQQTLNLSIGTAGEIVKEVNDKVFFPIRHSLEQLNDPNRYKAAPAPQVENFSPAGNVSAKNIETRPDPLPVADNNAIIIGNAAPIGTGKAAGERMFDEKMGKLFRLPKEQVELGTTTPPPTAPTAPKSADPYREMPS